MRFFMKEENMTCRNTFFKFKIVVFQNYLCSPSSRVNVIVASPKDPALFCLKCFSFHTRFSIRTPPCRFGWNSFCSFFFVYLSRDVFIFVGEIFRRTASSGVCSATARIAVRVQTSHFFLVFFSAILYLLERMTSLYFCSCCTDGGEADVSRPR